MVTFYQISVKETNIRTRESVVDDKLEEDWVNFVGQIKYLWKIITDEHY